jgi:hypothetical protein
MGASVTQEGAAGKDKTDAADSMKWYIAHIS